ncbi:AMP-binding protein [Streptomyces vilmorinianum]|uniref:AMP-binding protein n=1 Tax=Streptomyces vilmorinianum TaxID=3051092 RepID=UPI0010FB4D1E|nr:AMP-binding protein [Streptomyces vilmorinianum]
MTAPPLLLPDTRTVPFAADLAAHGDRTAVLTTDGAVSYRELAARVQAVAERLGTARRLVLLVAANTLDALVVHLAALASGNPLLLVPGDHPDAVRSLIEAYDPDVIARPGDERGCGGEGGERGEGVAPDGLTRSGWVLDERRAETAHTLHPDLALLLSTSGSTGSPKLVRLSHENLQSNAAAIAQYLDIRDTDVAATTLPLHYCYGLSVVHSHLLRGAGLLLTDLSVSDACFWDRFRAARATTFAGVPYTFDLLDRIGFDAMDLPHLRYVTQAGGRLAPDRVARYAALGRARGWDLFVMYGQTEATARMAYLPPELAESRPGAVGVPIPGGAFRLRPLPEWTGEDDGGSTGELLYSGPNVMLGYAESPRDLGLGRTLSELPTGDVARRAADGLYEVVGRTSRFAKILGLRIDPQQIETVLAAEGVVAACVGADDELLVAVEGDPGAFEAGPVRRRVTGLCGLPARAVRVGALPALPRLTTGKIDYGSVAEALRGIDLAPLSPGDGSHEDLVRLYATILDRDDVTPDSSFVGLGGDSLSYVEMSLHLEETLGTLPDHWHLLPLRELRAAATPRLGTHEESAPAPDGRLARMRARIRARIPARVRARARTVETGIALRAVAIVLIVGSHIQIFTVKGGAHVLLGVAGYNFARFHLTPAGRADRVRGIGRSLMRIVLPCTAWLALMMLVTDDYGVRTVFLLTSLLGPNDGFWFVESLVYTLLLVSALLAFPYADRAERRFPFAFPMVLTGVGLVGRYDLLGLDAQGHVPLAATLFWLFGMGWAAARACGVAQRAAVTAVALATVPGLFGQPAREAVVVGGLVLLIWVRRLPSLGVLNRLAGLLAGSSLYIYVTHWQVFPRLDAYPLLALAAALLFGVAFAAATSQVTRRLPALRPLAPRPAT